MIKKIPIYLAVMFLAACLICGCGGGGTGSGGATSATGAAFTASAPAGNVVLPGIKDIAPLTADVGGEITITGERFGNSVGRVELVDNEYNKTKNLNIVSWEDNKIVCSMVKGIAGGNLAVYNSANTKNGEVFTVKAGPSLDVVIDTTQNTTNSGVVGDTVIINGSGFGTSKTAVTVTFNGTAATEINSCNPYYVICVVPSGASTGSVVVTVSGSSASGVTFTVNGNANVTVQ